MVDLCEFLDNYSLLVLDIIVLLESAICYGLVIEWKSLILL